MLRSLFLCISVLVIFWPARALCKTVFSSSQKAHMLLRSRRANTFIEEIKPPSLERECKEEVCSFEEAREIFQTREATLNFWTVYTDGDQCASTPCVNGKCMDMFQDYSCNCNPGFEGRNCHLRSTASNCTVNIGDCNHACHEKEDGLGRTCSCIKGYQLQEDSKKCTPINKDSCGQILIPKSSYKKQPLMGLMPWLVAGTIGKKGESPWQALILKYGHELHCGGVLIDENWVLTAAHCLESSTRLTVRLGDYERLKAEGTEMTFTIKQAITHPQYNDLTLDSDIALLRLSGPTIFSTYILPACLPSRDLAEKVLHRNGTMTVVTGWGTNNETANHFISTLNFIDIPVIDSKVCSTYMNINVTQNMLCGGVLGEIKDSCKGDSGGPMMTMYHDTWFLIGLVSGGKGCGQKNKLGIYTKVSSYVDWIDSVRQKWDKV